MFSGYESLNLRPLHLKTRCTIIYWFGMSISKCCDVIKHFPYSRAVLLIATVYVFIYHLYDPSHFADPSYARTGFNKETSEAFYTVDLSTKKFPGFRTIHAKNPFTTRTHVLSNLSLTQRADRFPTVIKEQLC